MPKINIGALISGRGSNLQAVIDACSEGRITGEVKIVISNNTNAYGFLRAQKAGIEHCHLTNDAEIIQTLVNRNINLVILAGYLKIISPAFVAAFPNRIMNIHPALLPAFPGLHAQQQATDYGVKISGATVHFVDTGLDTGPIILQKAVPVAEQDTVQSLATRILAAEHELYPKAIQLFATGRLKVTGRKVQILNPENLS
jgi:phosphoribosylglycinamide formyltransferase 1